MVKKDIEYKKTIKELTKAVKELTSALKKSKVLVQQNLRAPFPYYALTYPH